MTARSGLGRLQSIPVDGLRCTLSTASDEAAIGSPVTIIAVSAEWGPERTSRGPGKPRAPLISGHRRAQEIRPTKVATPPRPTHGETSLRGKHRAAGTGG